MGDDTRYIERDVNSSLIRFNGPEPEMEKWVEHYNRLHSTPYEVDDFIGHPYIGTPRRLSEEERVRIAREHNLPLMRMVNQAGFAVMFNGFQVPIRGRHYEISIAEQERIELAYFIKSPFKMDMSLEMRGLNPNDSTISGGFWSPEMNAFERALKTGEGMEDVYTPAMMRLLYEEPDRAGEWQSNLNRHLKGEPILAERYDGTHQQSPEWLRREIRQNTLNGNSVFFLHPQDREYMTRVVQPFLRNQPPRPMIDSPPEVLPRESANDNMIPFDQIVMETADVSVSLITENQEGQLVTIQREMSRQIEEEGLCIACLERPVQTMVLPCEHHVLCIPCSTKMVGTPNENRCIYCRQNIDEILKE